TGRRADDDDTDSVGNRLDRLYRLSHDCWRDRVGLGNQHDRSGSALPRQSQEAFEVAKAEASVERIAQEHGVDIGGHDLWRRVPRPGCPPEDATTGQD